MVILKLTVRPVETATDEELGAAAEKFGLKWWESVSQQVRWHIVPRVGDHGMLEYDGKDGTGYDSLPVVRVVHDFNADEIEVILEASLDQFSNFGLDLNNWHDNEELRRPA
jgi:hypothetical protein